MSKPQGPSPKPSPEQTAADGSNVDSGVSRRSFVATSAAGVGAAGPVRAAGPGCRRRPRGSADQRSGGDPPHQERGPRSGRVPDERRPGVRPRLRQRGPQGAVLCAPGNYQVINAIAAEGIPTYGGRTEGSMCAAADGFIRVTGEAAACSGTEGPGFTNMIMNIGAANAARTPLLVLASNMTVGGDDTERGIQRGYQQPTTVGLKKYGKRLITPNRVYEYAAYAFRHLRTGRAKTGPPRLHRRGRTGPVRIAGRPALLPRQERLPHRVPSTPVQGGHPEGRRDDREGRTADHGRLDRRVLRPGLGCPAHGGRARRHRRRRIRARRAATSPDSHPLSVSTGTGCPAFGGPRHLRRPVLDAERRRSRLRPGRQGDPHRPGRGRHRPQPAGRSGTRRERPRRPGGSRGGVAGGVAARLARRTGCRPRRVREAERGVVRTRTEAQRRDGHGPSRRDRPGTLQLPLLRRPAEGADDGGLGRLRHRPLHPAVAASPPAGPES